MNVLPTDSKAKHIEKREVNGVMQHNKNRDNGGMLQNCASETSQRGGYGKNR